MRKIMCFIGALIVCFSTLSACQSSDNKVESKSKSHSENPSAKGKFKDQTDLKIGDTGKVESTVGKYEITVKSIKLKNEIGGEASQIDHLFLTEMTLKNIGDQPIDAAETIGVLELTDDLEGSGSPNDSDFYEVSKPFSGEVKPGQSVTGEAVFQGLESKVYYIRTNPGLIAAKAVKNKATWTFKKSEAE